MNIIILSCLNLDLLDLAKFTGQFKPSIPATPQTPINYYLIDHLGQDQQPIKSQIPHTQSDGTSITRIDINKFIEKETENELILPQPKHENIKTTTHKLYKEYLAYLNRAAAPNRKLIENIFYHNPEYIDFIKYYLFSIIKLVGLISDSGSIGTEIWSCDPIFHWLLEALRTYYPLSVDTFYNQFQQQGTNQQLIICGPPTGWPITFPPGIGITRLSKTTFAKFGVPFLEQQHEVIPPPILNEFRSTDDIYNLDLLNDYIASGNQQVFQGEIKGVLGLDDITTGLTQIFQDQIINRQLRIPRHCLKTQDQGFEILIQRQQIPHIRNIQVLADLSQQLEPRLLERHQELIARELSGLHTELDNLALEWELRIQKFIKLPIKIRFADQ
jgi:hypothetical protein